MNPYAKSLLIVLLASLASIVSTAKSSSLATVQLNLTRESPQSKAKKISVQDLQSPLIITIQSIKYEYTQQAINQVLNQREFPLSQQKAESFKQSQKDLQIQFQKQAMDRQLSVSVRLIIKTAKLELSCFFGKASDLCLFQDLDAASLTITAILEPKKASDSDSGNDVENQQFYGQYVIRQTEYEPIPHNQIPSVKKLPYKTGLYRLPQTSSHSVMLLSCQDDNLPSLQKNLKIYSSVPYKIYSGQSETNVIVGFDRTEHSVNQNSRSGFVYLDLQNAGMRKCVKLQHFSSNKLANGHKIMDFVNMTDMQYSNRYHFYDVNSKTESNFFNYNMVLSLNVFMLSPQTERSHSAQLQQRTDLDLRLKLIDQDSKSSIATYLFKNVISGQESNRLESHKINDLYSSSHHHHINYIVGAEMIKNVKHISLQIQIEGGKRHSETVSAEVRSILDQNAHPMVSSTQDRDFIFFSVTADDIQNIVVEKLTTSHMSAMKNEQLNFIIEEPFSIDDDIVEDGHKVSELVTIEKSSNAIEISLTEHSSDHQHTTECHFSQGCKFQAVFSEDCPECSIRYKAEFVKQSEHSASQWDRPNSGDQIMLVEIKQSIFQSKIDLDESLYFYYKLPVNKIVELIVNTPNVIVYTLEGEEQQHQCQIPSSKCHSQAVTSHEPIIIDSGSVNLHSQDVNSEQRIVLLTVEGLDKTNFKLEFVDFEKEVHLINGQSFSYKIPEESEVFQMLFNIPDFIKGEQYFRNVSINLVSPLNSLQMSVSNSKVQTTAEDIFNQDQMQGIHEVKTLTGYIKLREKDINSPQIKITLSKTDHYEHHSVHFTIVAMTSDHKYRLDTGITHYESLQSHQIKHYLIEFAQQRQYSLNIHIYDVSVQERSTNDQKQYSSSSHTNISLSIYNPSAENLNSESYKMTILSDSHNVLLDEDVIEQHELCPDDDSDCELSVKISSLMPYEVEMSITLLSKDSIVELKDGIWENYELDELLLSTHFFFIPTHIDKPTKIFFHSNKSRFRLYAVLYDFSHTPNPQDWPFPRTHKEFDQEELDQVLEEVYFNTKELVQIDQSSEEFLDCFPKCVVLMSLREIESPLGLSESQDDPQGGQQGRKMSILASNNEIELPQKQRMALELKAQEEQLLLINLKQAFNRKRQFFTFFTNYIVGYANVYSKVYQPSLRNMVSTEEYDFLFDPIQTQIGFEQVIRKFVDSMIDEGFQMDDLDFDQNEDKTAQNGLIEGVFEKDELYLAILIKAEEATRMTIEYTTDYDEIQTLQIDSSLTLVLEEGEQKIMQFVPVRDEKVRFIRNVGYPLFHQFKCQETDYDSCLQSWLGKLSVSTGENDIRNLKKEQIVDQEIAETPKLTAQKMKEFASLAEQEHFSQYQVLQRSQNQHVLECQKCVIFIWVYALERSELSIQLQTLNTEINLKENKLINDFLDPSEFHRYFLTRVQAEETVITITVNEGEISVTVTDNLNYESTKKSELTLKERYSQRRAIVFKVPPVKSALNSQSNDKRVTDFLSPGQRGNPESKMDTFNTLFSNLHISISTEKNVPASYSITYSSGSHEMELKNGVISKYILFENQVTTLYYETNQIQESNEVQGSSTFLTLTVDGADSDVAQFLESLTVRIFSRLNQNHRQEVSSEQLSSLNHLQKRQSSSSGLRSNTLTFQLPKDIQHFEIELLPSMTKEVTIIINNNKILFLGLGYEVPLFLLPKEDIRVVIESTEDNFVEFQIKKCDQSNPLVFYTANETEFRLDSYDNYDKFSSNSNIFKHSTKVKAQHSLFVKIKAQQSQKSMLLIRAKTNDIGAASWVDTDPGNQGVISYQLLSPLQAQITFSGLQCGSQCSKETEFYLVKSTSLNSLHSRVTCAGQEIFTVRPNHHSSGKTTQTALTDWLHFGRQNAIPSSQVIITSLEGVSPDSTTNQIQLELRVESLYRFVAIKAIHKPTKEQIYYRPIEIQGLLSNSTEKISSNFLYEVIAVISLIVIVIVLVTKRCARKGYLHVGEEEVIVA